MALTPFAYAANTHGNPNIESQMWWGDAFTPYIFSGCTTVVPSSSLVIAAFTCSGWVEGASGEFIYVTQPSHSLTLVSTGDDRYLLALHKDTSSTVASWNRIPNTHYIWQKNGGAISQPASGRVFGSATVSGGVITAVAKLGSTSIFTMPGSTGAALPTPNVLNRGQLVRQSNGGVTVGARGLKASTGTAWAPIASWNVLEWGMIPNVNDAATGAANVIALQAAVTEAVAYASPLGFGIELYIPGGQYWFGNGTITIPSGGGSSIAIRGDGAYTSQLRKISTATGHMFTVAARDKPTSIQQLGLIGDGTGLVYSGVACTTCNGLFVDHVWAASWFDGISVSNGGSIWITNTVSEAHAHDGFVLDGQDVHCNQCTAYAVSSGFVFTTLAAPAAYPRIPNSCVSCTVSEALDKGFHVTAAAYVDLIAPTIWSSARTTYKGIVIEASDHINVIGGSSAYLIEHGVYLTGANTNIKVEGHSIANIGAAGATGKGIETDSSGISIQLVNNVISTTRSACIKEGASAQVSIVGNHLNDCALNDTVGDKAAILVGDTSANKSAHIRGNSIGLNAAGTGVGIAFIAGSLGNYYISENDVIPTSRTIHDLTNAPAGIQKPMIFHNSAQRNITMALIGAVPGSVSDTITVPGALFGDQVSIGTPADFDNTALVVTAKVSAANTVRIVFLQFAGVATTPPAGIYTATVTRYAY